MPEKVSLERGAGDEAPAESRGLQGMARRRAAEVVEMAKGRIQGDLQRM